GNNLRLLIRPGPVPQLSFTALANHSYTVQYAESFGAQEWFTLADVAASPSEHSEILSDPTLAPHRFYRLMTPLQPLLLPTFSFVNAPAAWCAVDAAGNFSIPITVTNNDTIPHSVDRRADDVAGTAATDVSSATSPKGGVAGGATD